MAATNSAAINYGAVEDPTDNNNNNEESFDVKNTYYLKDRPLTLEHRMRKLVLVGVPILVAVSIVGCMALFLLRDFDVLYPAPHGSTSTSTNSKEPSFHPPPPASTTTRIHDSVNDDDDEKSDSQQSPAPPISTSNSDMASSCFAHEKCTGLVGECCPTKEGNFLDCCY